MQTHFSLWFIYKQFNFILHKGMELVTQAMCWLFIYLLTYLWLGEWNFLNRGKMNEEEWRNDAAVQNE